MNSDVIDKVLSGKASAEEAAQVARYFQQPQGGLDLVERIDRDLNMEWEKQHKQASHVSLRHWLYRVACAAAIVVCTIAGSCLAYRYLVMPTSVTQQVAWADRGERTQLVLQDGTRIYLNSQSRIVFPSQFAWKERRIRLEGEAYFEVSKNPHRPFVVELNNAEVTVLGTRFNAKSYADEQVQVTLDEGSVRFSAPNIEDVLMQPGEQVCYDAQLALAKVSCMTDQRASAWRSHRIEIVNMPLQEVVKLLERQYDVTFNVHGAKCYRHSFTLSMDDESLREVLSRMDRISPLTFVYSEQNKKVEIY